MGGLSVPKWYRPNGHEKAHGPFSVLQVGFAQPLLRLGEIFAAARQPQLFKTFLVSMTFTSVLDDPSRIVLPLKYQLLEDVTLECAY